MMCIISPAKKLNFKPVATKEFSQVRCTDEMTSLVHIMKTKKPADLMKLMDISKELADLNVNRYRSFDINMPKEKSKQALFAFNGDVYQGLQAQDFTAGDIKFAQTHLRILSGLYGLLRPLDLIQEYRLEMGSALKNPKGKNLYEFWGSTITSLLNADMAAAKDTALINLASEEYFEVLNPSLLKGKLIHIRFEEKRAKGYQVISFSAKKARGFMARYIIKNRLKQPTQIKNFSEERYSFEPNRSHENQYTFVR
jgi:uncharacterized protein